MTDSEMWQQNEGNSPLKDKSGAISFNLLKVTGDDCRRRRSTDRVIDQRARRRDNDGRRFQSNNWKRNFRRKGGL